MENTMKINIDSLESVRQLGEFIRKGLIMDNINVSQLARDLGVDRRTVKKYMNNDFKKDRKPKKSKVAKHHTIIEDIVEDNAYLYLQHIYNVLVREHNADYSLSTFKRYFYLNFKEAKSSKQVTARFETEPGFQAQMDYKEDQSYVGDDGFIYKTDILALTLSNSRYTLRKPLANKSTLCTINALIDMFEELGGVPKQLVFDNPKALVTTPKKGDEPAVLNTKFEQFLKDFNIQPFACAPYRPETKGKVEVQMKCVDELLVYNGQFKSRLTIADKLQRITSDNNSKYSQATNTIPKFGIKKELDNMLPLPSANILSSYKFKFQTVKVSNECMFTYKSNKYSVSKDLIGKTIQYYTLDNCLYIYYKSNYVCMHKISNEKLNYTDNHFKQNQEHCYDNGSFNTGTYANCDSNEQQMRENFSRLASKG